LLILTESDKINNYIDMTGQRIEARRQSPLTVGDAARGMRRLHGALAEKAQPLTTDSLSGLNSLAFEGQPRRSQPTGEITVALPPITVYDGTVMLGARSSSDKRSIHVPLFIKKPEFFPEVVFGKDLRNFGRYEGFYETGPYENIVYTYPFYSSREIPLKLSSPPILPLEAELNLSEVVSSILAYDK
jgi:hypothetical protein